MAEERHGPYSQFNFLVRIGESHGKELPDAAFHEVSGLGAEITVAKYRSGDDPINDPMKISGRPKYPDVTFKRGVFRDAEILRAWMQDAPAGKRTFGTTVVIQLQKEDRTGPVRSWVLHHARPIKYSGPSLSATGTDVAVEALVLSCEGIDTE
jgi:phage tail-like protein